MFAISRKSPAPHKKEEDKKPHIKKPLNAFMLYMKEMRAKVVAECTLKESAAINQILGRRVSHTHTHKHTQVCARVFGNPLISVVALSTVAFPVKRGTSQILRAGQERKATPLPALPRMVGTR